MVARNWWCCCARAAGVELVLAGVDDDPRGSRDGGKCPGFPPACPVNCVNDHCDCCID